MKIDPVFSDKEKAMFAGVLEERFQRVGLADLLNQKCESTNNHLDEGLFKDLAGGYHLVKDKALAGV